MKYINLSTASAWDIGIALECERQAEIDRYTDDRDETEDEEGW